MNLCDPDAVLIMLGKLRELYSKEMLNMLGKLYLLPKYRKRFSDVS